MDGGWHQSTQVGVCGSPAEGVVGERLGGGDRRPRRDDMGRDLAGRGVRPDFAGGLVSRCIVRIEVARRADFDDVARDVIVGFGTSLLGGSEGGERDDHPSGIVVFATGFNFPGVDGDDDNGWWVAPIDPNRDNKPAGVGVTNPGC